MTKKVTTSSLFKMKQEKQKITALTAYDASFAKLFDEQGVDVILIGDSLGMVLQGCDDTLSVTIDDIAYHTRSVRKGTSRAFVVADMPFMTYATPEQTYANAATLMAAGASMVKVEGGDWLIDTIKGLNLRGVPVCGHLGLTPQSVHVFGGFKVQGRGDLQAERLFEQAEALAQAGVQMLVLECVPAPLAEKISKAINIPVIGIGAGAHTDGQILVMHDMFGISANYMPKFSKNYLEITGDMREAVKAYIEEVQNGVFPSAEHSFN
ncbi:MULTISPECIES: 3-methyl-2-oxobutanoate hydroxymethyltransferase [Aliiglaciecola]|uniref:3-methyl-2-oxobutanoate hydroxymethyltransferase n=1 Tax=Aliiglaciecola TaxID=1406885 RepID=UPI001C08BF83|nr:MULTISPECIES: 3-methyl-2-oxobutanoate hydroxymethyltransferase [Aliiglaciecola]MBU2878897.1 3-methyl-2-oxobutanoate hydroxymethyltransferase [Aliiglaciecola lipolytica]MDO6712956.1 3-methyl-2-oxobutanoate hydroxymethyltransferase [Aliiglaciecola sp. 2_MG-2023]MDO6753995.1 3-methyl-2-oxobutanoate hydroxymethyltransferase [Aliiglaciecola sp. 1_MG-2023]